MYGLSPSTDLTFLIGLHVTDVSETEYQTQIKLEHDVELSLNDCDYTLNGVRVSVDGVERLRGLVGATVLTAEVAAPGDARLGFDSGDSLVAHDSNAPQYESYTITTPERFIVV